MAFCGNCGTKTGEDIRFCPSCGTEIGTAPNPPAQPEGSAGYVPPVVPAAPTQGDIRDAQDNRTISMVAYLLFFVPLLTGAHKTSFFARFHTNQGTVLFIAAVIWGISYGILSVILLFIPLIGWLLLVILSLSGLFFVALCIVGIVNAANGTMKPLPLIGGFQVIK